MGGFTGSGGGGSSVTPIWNLNNPVGTESLNASTLAPAGQTWGSGSSWSQGLKELGGTMKGGVGGGITQMPDEKPQGLPAGAPTHGGQGPDLGTLLQLLQARRNLLLNLGRGSGGASGSNLLGM
jgi:hypothetical protein